MASVILVLDPDEAALEAWSTDLGSLGYRAYATTDPKEACTVLRSEHPGLLLCDVRSLPENSSRLLSSLREVDPDLPIIILTDLAAIEVAVEALRDGALFYLLRPFTLSNLKMAVERGFTHRQRVLQTQLPDQRRQPNSAEVIVGTSRPLQQVLELAGTVARSDANIIIFGESGTGKELFA
jgi:DNA-binding NtrC family response regulator